MFQQISSRSSIDIAKNMKSDVFSFSELNRKCKDADGTLENIFEMEEKDMFMPILNLMCNTLFVEDPLCIHSSSFSKNLELFSEVFGEEQFSKFLIIARAYGKDKIRKEMTKKYPLHSAICNASLPMIYRLHKYVMPDAYPRPPSEYQSKDGITRSALAADKEIFYSIFNMSIIKLKWIDVSATDLTRSDDEEFKFQSNRIVNLLFATFNEITQLRDEYLIKLTHIVIYEMFDECTDKALVDLLVYMRESLGPFYICRTPIRCSKKHKEEDLKASKNEFMEKLYNIYQFYKVIFNNDSEGVEHYISSFNNNAYYAVKDDFLPLYIAIQRNNSDIARILIHQGNVNFFVTDYMKTSLAHWCMKLEKFDIISDMDIITPRNMFPDALGRRPLYYAIKFQNYDAFEFCMGHKMAERDECDIFEKTYLMLAAKHGNLYIFENLFELFKRPNSKYLYTINNISITDYFSLFSIAVDRGNTEICEYLISKDSEVVNVETLLGITPLVIAMINADTDMMLKLLAHGAKINVRIPKNLLFKSKTTSSEKENNLIPLETLMDNYQPSWSRHFDDILTFAHRWHAQHEERRRLTTNIIIQQYAIQRWRPQVPDVKTYIDYYQQCERELIAIKAASKDFINILQQTIRANETRFFQRTGTNIKVVEKLGNRCMKMVESSTYKCYEYKDFLIEKIKEIFKAMLNSIC